MHNRNFIQENNLFGLNTLKCLRNEYLYNDCRLCFSACPTNALGLMKNKIHLDAQSCTSCGDCIGICPTESLSLENFDVNSFVLEFLKSDNNRIVETIDIPSFGMFDTYHLLSLVLRARHNIFLEYKESITSKELDYIDEVVQKSNYFLASIGFESSLFLKQHQKEVQNSARRNLFKNLVQTKKELTKEVKVSHKLNEKEKTVPSKLILFKNSLKLVCEDIQQPLLNIDDEKTVLYNKSIDFDACTNCVECITFCPTNALFQSPAKDAIYFQAGKCIGCEICQSVCQPNAIKSESTLDMIAYMFDQAAQLVEFEYIKCTQCNGAFINKNQGDVCERCADYANNFDKMFTLAKDM